MDTHVLTLFSNRAGLLKRCVTTPKGVSGCVQGVKIWRKMFLSILNAIVFLLQKEYIFKLLIHIKVVFCILLVINMSLLGINRFVYVWNELCSTQINIIFQCKTIHGFCFLNSPL